MTEKLQAHRILDAVRNGDKSIPFDQIRWALIITGDISGALNAHY